MLKVDNHTIIVNGSKLDLLAEFTALVHNLAEKKVFSKEDIELCVEIGLKPVDDVEKEAKEALQRLFNNLDNLFK